MAVVNFKFSVSMLCLAIVSIFLHRGCAGAETNPFCKNTEDPNFCTLLVKNAKTAKEATANAINASLEVAKREKPAVDGVAAILPSVMSQQTRESIISTCNENYEMVMDNLMGALEDLKDGDKYSLITKLSVPCLWDCVNGLEEFDVYDADMERASQEITKYVGYSLHVSTQI